MNASEIVVHAAPSGALELALVPSAVADHAQALLDAAQSPETRRVYAARWRVWEAFCAKTGATTVPASPEALGAFLTASLMAGRSLSWVGQVCAALRIAHERAGHPSPADHPVIRTLLKGARRVHGRPAKGKRDLDLATLRVLVDAMPRGTTSLVVARDRALILLGWWAALRRSELVALTVEDIREQDDGIVVLVRRSKTDASGRGAQVAVPRAQSMALCACEALRVWREMAGIKSGPLFPRVLPDDRLGVGGLTSQGVARILRRCLWLAGLPAVDYAAHSLRSGFATEAARQGRPIERIREHLRHGSIQTTARYVRAGRILADAVGRGLA